MKSNAPFTLAKLPGAKPAPRVGKCGVATFTPPTPRVPSFDEQLNAYLQETTRLLRRYAARGEYERIGVEQIGVWLDQMIQMETQEAVQVYPPGRWPTATKGGK